MIKQLIKEQQYDKADALLVLSDHPDADKLRERLAALRVSGGGAGKGRGNLTKFFQRLALDGTAHTFGTMFEGTGGVGHGNLIAWSP